MVKLEINILQWNPTLGPLRQHSHLIIVATLFWPEKKLISLFKEPL